MNTPIQIAQSAAVEYSSVCPFSAGNRWLLLQVPEGRFGLFTGDGEFRQLLPPEITHHSEPRWSRSEPNRLYFVSGHSLMGLVIGEPGSPLATAMYREHEFTEYIEHDDQGRDGLSGLGESDISPDGDHFVFRGLRPDGGAEIFIYSISAGSKGPTFPQTVIDGLKITSSNKIVLSKSGESRGLYLIDGFTSSRLTDSNGHAAVTRFKGRDRLLWCSSDDKDINSNSVAMVDIESGQNIILYTFGWEWGMHISACDLDFFLVSLFDPKNTGKPQLWQIPTAKPQDGRMLCETSGVVRDYDSQPHAALSRDGSRAVFNVDDGERVSVFMIRLDTNVDYSTPDMQGFGLETRIDYSKFMDSEFIMRPRPDGAVDIFERKRSS